jgi:hypothetical protein
LERREKSRLRGKRWISSASPLSIRTPVRLQSVASVDQFLYREDGVKGAEESIRWMQEFIALSDTLETDGIGALIETGNALEIQRFLRGRLFPRSSR